MATAIWYSNGNHNWDATNAWNSQADGGGTAGNPDTTDDHAIIQNGDTVTLTGDETTGSLFVDDTGTIVGGNNTLSLKGSSDDNLFRWDGTISGDLNIKILSGDNKYIKDNGGTGDIKNLTIEHDSTGNSTYLASALTLTALFINAGGLNTNSSNDYALTVTGNTTINGQNAGNEAARLSLNGSTALLGSNNTSGGINVNNGAGFYADSDSTVTMGYLDANYDGSNEVKLLGTNTINSHSASTNRILKLTSGVIDAAGTSITITTATTGKTISCFDTQFENLTLTPASATTYNMVSSGINIAGNLIINANATLDTTTSNYPLTVAGATDVTGTLTLNNSTVSLGALRANSGAAITQGSSGTLELTSNDAGLNAGFGDRYAFKNDDATSDINLAGTMTISNANYSLFGTAPAGASVVQNLVINKSHYWINTLTLGGTLVVNASKHFQTYGSATGGSRAIKVTGDVTLNGHLTTYKATELDLAAEFKSLTINSGGTYTATAGTTTITGIESGASRSVLNSGTLTHNSGTFLFNGDMDQKISTNSTGRFNNITLNKSNNDFVFIDSSTTVEGNLDITMGDNTRQCRPSSTSGNITVTGNVIVREGILLRAANDCTGTMSFGSLEIQSGGIYAATSGTTTITVGDFSHKTGGTFTHNNGEVVIASAGGDVGGSSTGTIFYKLESTSYVDLTKSITVENRLKAGGSSSFRFPNDITITMGTASVAGEIQTGSSADKGLRFNTASKTIKFAATSQLKPWFATDSGAGWNIQAASVKVQLENGDFQYAFETDPNDRGFGGEYELTGDMEFDAVTVNTGDTLDLNGQRAVVSGVLSGSGAMNANNSTLIFTGTSGTVFDGGEGPDLSITDSTDCTFICDAGSGSQVWKNRFQSSDATIFVQSGTLSLSYWNWEDITNFFVGGTFNNSSANRNVTTDNLTIPTGGVLSAGSGTLTCAGDFTTSGGLIGKSALTLSASVDNDAVNIPDDNTLDLTTAMTLEGWVKTTGTDSFQHLVCKSGGFYFISVYNAGGGATGKAMVRIYDGANIDAVGTSQVNDGKWHHIAGTYDTSAGKLKLYVDGKLEAETSNSDAINTGTTNLFLGSNDATTNELTGTLARASVWNVALTQAQIREMLFYDFATADSEGTIPDANCVGWWQFDEGTGTAVADSSTSNNDGTIGTPTWAGAGTFTYGTSTVDMTGNGTWTYQGDFSFYNFKVAAASKTTTYKRLSSGTINIANNLYIGAGSFTRASSVTWRLGYDGATSSRVNTGVGSILSGATDPIDFSSSYVAYFNDEAGTFNSNVKIEYLITSYPLTLTNSLEGTGYLWASNNLFDIADQTCTTPQFRMNDSANAKINIDSGTLNLTSTSSGAGFRPNFPSNTFTAGPGATVIGPAGKAFFESQNNFVIVGKAENLNVTNEELSVTGQVINCTGEIHQQFPTIDHDQQLDFDTADDRDIILGRDLDKNTELINS